MAVRPDSESGALAARAPYLATFRTGELPSRTVDTLVIGTGVAGMRAAIEAATRGQVLILTKTRLPDSNTALAQGGIAAAVGADDAPAMHLSDTLRAGVDLCDAAAAAVLVEEGPRALGEVLGWGMRVDRDADGQPALGREGGHSRRRIVHSDGAATGLALVACLGARARAHPAIDMLESTFVIDLLTGDRSPGRRGVVGALVARGGRLEVVWAGSTILAAGGAGQVYRQTTNPEVATGDGIAMAYRAGARIADLEFIQFHPTTLFVDGRAERLVSEAVRGEGAWLIDADGHRFMVGVHELAELAPRDVISRTIVEHLAQIAGEVVYLDVRHLDAPAFERRFPGLTQELRRFGIDPRDDPIPVHPSAHYTIGGVWTDRHGRTSVPGLYACGEAAATGAHGANRLASNSLLEGLVFGRRAGLAATADVAPGVPRDLTGRRLQATGAEPSPAALRGSLRDAMWTDAGLCRSAGSLDRAARRLVALTAAADALSPDTAVWELQNLIDVAKLVTTAASHREESRGAHWRSDYPDPDHGWRRRFAWEYGRRDPIALSGSGQAEGNR